MFTRYLILSAIVCVSWCLILSPVPAVVTALAVLAFAGAIGGLYVVLTVPYRYQAIPVTVYAVPVGFQEVVAPPAVVVQEVASEMTGASRAAYQEECEVTYLASLATLPVEPSPAPVFSVPQPTEQEALNAKRRAAALKGLETKRRNAARKLAEKEAAAKVAPKIKSPRKPRAAAKASRPE